MRSPTVRGVTNWLRTARRPSVVRRALLYAAVVGPVLVAINHGDAILTGALEPGQVVKMGLTLAVPYLVSTCSSVGALRRLAEPGAGPRAKGLDE